MTLKLPPSTSRLNKSNYSIAILAGLLFTALNLVDLNLLARCQTNETLPENDRSLVASLVTNSPLRGAHDNNNYTARSELKNEQATNTETQSEEDSARFTRSFAYAAWPAGIDAVWPMESKFYRKRQQPPPSQSSSSAAPEKEELKISVLAPALAVQVEKDFPALIASIKDQTVQADDFVVVISGTKEVKKDVKKDSEDEEGLEFCEKTYHYIKYHLSGSPTEVRIFCVGERVPSGLARNIAARIAKGDIFVFIDADDQMLPMRNEVVRNVFECRPSLKLFLHSAAKTNKKILMKNLHPYVQKHMAKDGALSPTREMEPKDIVPALMKYGLLPSTPNKTRTDTVSMTPTTSSICVEEEEGVEKMTDVEFHANILKSKAFWGDWYPKSLVVGHIVSRRGVFDYIPFGPMKRGEDQLFLRHFFSVFTGNGTALFLNRPLTSYNQQSFSANKQNYISSKWIQK